MIRPFKVIGFLVIVSWSAFGLTVYRNEKLFSALEYGGRKPLFSNGISHLSSGSNSMKESYKYPGETKKPNGAMDPSIIKMTFDDSPEFVPEPRNVSTMENLNLLKQFNDEAHDSPSPRCIIDILWNYLFGSDESDSKTTKRLTTPETTTPGPITPFPGDEQMAD